MASFIPQVQATGYDTVKPYEPDFSWMSGILSAKETQYEKGLSSIASGYSSIVNAPITDYGNIQKRKEYINAAQEGLKKITTQDLSKDKNVRQAEALYAPFWEDDIMLNDIGYTKYATKELSKLESWKMSNDKDVRSQYSDYSKIDIQQGLADLSMAGRDPLRYKMLTKREAVPFYDIDKEVDAAWTTEMGSGKGVETLTSDGMGGMITEFNGIKSRDAYKTYYLSKLRTGRYDPQLKVMARVNMYNAKKGILRQNPDMTEGEVNERMASDYITNIAENYKSVAESYNTQSVYWEDRKKALIDQINQNQNGNVTDEQRVNLLEYDRRAKDYKTEAGKYNQTYWDEYSPVTINGKRNDKYFKTIEGIATYPEDYISANEKMMMADIWASGRASISSMKKELDPVWNAYREQRNKDIEHQLTRRGQDVTSRGQTLDWMQRTGTDLNGNPLPGFDPRRSSGWYGGINDNELSGGSNQLNPGSGDIVGYNTVEPAKLPDGTDIIYDALDKRAKNVSNQVFNADTDGISAIVLGQLGMDKNQIIDFTQAAKTMSDGTHLTNSKQIEAWNEGKRLLKEHGIGYDINGPLGMETAMLEYASSTATQLRNSPKQSDKELGNKLLAGYLTAQTQRDIYLKSKQNLDQAVKREIETDKKYKPLFTKDGQRITVNMMKADLFKDILLHDKNGNPYILTSGEMAKKYLAGEIEINTVQTGNGPQREIVINGEKYLAGSPQNAYGEMGPEQVEENRMINKFVDKYGESKILGKLAKDASSAVLGKMGEYKNGVIYKEISYDPNASIKGDKQEEQFALNLGPELANPGNTMTFYDGATGSPISPADEQAVRAVLSNTKDIKDNIAAIIPTRNAQNEKVYKVKFQSAGTGDHTPEAAGQKLSNFAGRTIELKVSPNASGRVMNSIPDNEGSYIYGDIYNGGSYTSNQLLKDMGITYTVRGYEYGQDGKATKASVVIKERVADPDHIGQYIDKPTVDVTIPLVGPQAKNADQIMQAVMGTVVSHGNQDVQNSKLAHDKTPKPYKLTDVLKEMQ